MLHLLIELNNLTKVRPFAVTFNMMRISVKSVHCFGEASLVLVCSIKSRIGWTFVVQCDLTLLFHNTQFTFKIAANSSYTNLLQFHKKLKVLYRITKNTCGNYYLLTDSIKRSKHVFNKISEVNFKYLLLHFLLSWYLCYS